MKSTKKGNLKVILLLFLISFLFRLYDIKAVGETWDEIAVVRNGAIYLRYISKVDLSSNSWQLNREHPPLAKYLYGATQILPQISQKIADIDTEYPLGRKFTLARVLSGVFGSVAVCFVYLLARLFYSEKISIFAALIFSFLPHVLAHTTIASLESPLLLFTLISTYFFLKNKFVPSGLLFGFALATKFNAGFFIILFLVLFIFLILEDKRREAYKSLLVPVVAVIFLFIIWPWLWSSPINNLFGSIKQSSDVADRQYFLGQDTTSPPIFYYFIYFMATTPIAILLFFFIFLVKTLTKTERRDLVILCYFLTPFLASFFSLKQDGVRYIFPFYPALAIGSSAGLFYTLDRLRGCLKKVSASLLSFATVTIVYLSLLLSVFSVQPYYLDYYNVLVGGPKNVYKQKLFEIGWWGEGVRESILYVNEKAFKGATVSFSFAPEHVVPILREDLERFDDSDRADYVVTNPFAEWYDGVWINPKDYDRVLMIQAANAPVAKVFKRRK